MLVHEQTADALADALRPLLTSPQRLTDMKQAARAFVRERFAVDRMVDKILRILDGEPESVEGERPAAAPTATWLRMQLDRFLVRMRK